MKNHKYPEECRSDEIDRIAKKLGWEQEEEVRKDTEINDQPESGEEAKPS
jgi:hypothetical protein